MLTFVTGNPGNGKSLYLVTNVEAQRLKECREVYYYGIPDLQLPWKPIELKATGAEGKNVCKQAPDWQGVPDGSIVVIDEAWEWFPVRTQGAAVPDYVGQLAKHRHRGLDIYLATQSVTKQVDSFIRDLCGKHIHLERKFGMQYAMVYEWERVGDPKTKADLALAQNRRWMFPKEVYGKYKSATEHTHKVKLPWKKFATLAAALLVAVGGIYYAFQFLKPKPKSVAVDSSGRASGLVVHDSGDFWVKDRRIRVAGVPASAPVYDKLQEVKSQPRPEGCMQLTIGRTVRCECTGPHGSVLAIDLGECLDLVKHGWFDETQAYKDAKVENIRRLDALESLNSKADETGGRSSVSSGGG